MPALPVVIAERSAFGAALIRAGAAGVSPHPRTGHPLRSSRYQPSGRDAEGVVTLSVTRRNARRLARCSRHARWRVGRPAAGIDAASMARQCPIPFKKCSRVFVPTASQATSAGGGELRFARLRKEFARRAKGGHERIGVPHRPCSAHAGTTPPPSTAAATSAHPSLSGFIPQIGEEPKKRRPEGRPLAACLPVRRPAGRSVRETCRQVVLAAVLVDRARLVLVQRVVLQLRVVQVAAVQRERQVLVDLQPSAADRSPMAAW